MAGPAGFPRSSARTPRRRVHSPLGLSGNLVFTASPHRFTDPLGGYAMRPLGPGLPGVRAAASPALLGGGQRPALTPPRSAARRSRHPQTQWEPLGQAPGPDRLGWRDQRASRRAWLGPQRRGRTGLPTKSAD